MENITVLLHGANHARVLFLSYIFILNFTKKLRYFILEIVFYPKCTESLEIPFNNPFPVFCRLVAVIHFVHSLNKVRKYLMPFTFASVIIRNPLSSSYFLDVVIFNVAKVTYNIVVFLVYIFFHI